MAESSYISSLMLLDENKILADLNKIAIELGLIRKINETSRIYVYYAVFGSSFYSGNFYCNIIIGWL